MTRAATRRRPFNWRRSLAAPRFWIGIALSVVLLAVALRGLSVDQLAAELSHAQYVWLVPASVMILIGQMGRAGRWRVLFGDGPRPAWDSAIAILSVGYLVSNLLPLRLGDAVRAWLIETRTPADGAAALATVMAERAIDLLTILLLFGFWVAEPGARLARSAFGLGPWLDATALRFGAVAAVGLAYLGIVGVSAVRVPAARRLGGVIRRLGIGDEAALRLEAGLARFLGAFAGLRNPRRGLAVLGWSLGIWLAGATGYWFVFKVFDLSLSLSAAVFAMCAAALFAAVLPPTPGYIGAFHTAIREALGLFAGVTAVRAASYALVLHAVTTAWLALLGAAGIVYLGVSARDLPFLSGGMPDDGQDADPAA